MVLQRGRIVLIIFLIASPEQWKLDNEKIRNGTPERFV